MYSLVISSGAPQQDAAQCDGHQEFGVKTKCAWRL